MVVALGVSVADPAWAQPADPPPPEADEGHAQAPKEPGEPEIPTAPAAEEGEAEEGEAEAGEREGATGDEAKAEAQADAAREAEPEVPPQPAAPPAPPAVAPQSVRPPPATAAVATAAAGPDAAADQADKDEVLPARVPWRGSSVKWGHTVTTTAIGVGRDNLSDTHEVYAMSWQLLLNYFLIDQDDYRLTVYTAPSFSVELTNSDWTTTEHEPQFNDLPLTFALSGTLYKPGAEGGDDSDIRSGSLLRTSGTARMSAYFPTSPASSANGTYLTTSPRLSLTQLLPVLGAESPVLKFIVVGASFRWDHVFSRATTPVSQDLDRPRQTASGETFLSDQLSFSPLALNTLTESVYLYFVEAFGGIELEAYAAVSMAHAFSPEFENNECAVVIETGCVDVEPNEDARTSQNIVGFSAGVTVYPMAEWGIELAYANQATQLGPDGRRRDIFYSPDAVFQANLLISIDALYERFTGPRRSGSYIIAKRQDKKHREAPSTGMLAAVF